MEDIFSEAPDRWDRIKFKYLGDFVGGGTPSKSENRYWNGDIPWVSPKDMKAYDINDTIDHLTQEGFEEGSCKLIEQGALLMVYRSGILDHTLPVAVNRVPVTLNQDMKGFIPDESLINVHYLTYLFRGHESRLLTLWSKEGTTVQSLESDSVENTKLPVPPLEEQKSIVSHLNDRTGSIDQLIATARELIDWLQEKRRSLIVRGSTLGFEDSTVQDLE
jgi:type I restriction enzyme S subunit